MIQVNSPFALSKIRPAKQFSELQNNYFYQLERSLQQIYQRTGGANDNISETEGLFSSTAYIMSIANQGIADIEELNAYNYARYQAELDSLKSLFEELSAKQCQINAALDAINTQLKELEGLSYGYHA